jgi:hypothetical protein
MTGDEMFGAPVPGEAVASHGPYENIAGGQARRHWKRDARNKWYDADVVQKEQTMSTTPAEAEIVHDAPPVALARVERSAVLLTPVMDVRTAMARLQEFQAFCAEYLSESHDGGNDGGDYGVIPGTKKKTLLKSGSDKLCEVYGLYDEYALISSVEDWERGLFDYTLKCLLKSRRDDSVVGTGVGSCSSYESKYRWREIQRLCPQCGKAAIIKGKAEFGGGWVCFKKKDGCGAKYRDGDTVIEGQTVGRIENTDIIDSKNTVLKMAKKRAKIDAVIGATRSSGIFTQDLEDLTAPTVQGAHPVAPVGLSPSVPNGGDSGRSDEGPDLGVDMPAGARRVLKVGPGIAGAKAEITFNANVGESGRSTLLTYKQSIADFAERMAETGEPVFPGLKQSASGNWRLEDLVGVPKAFNPDTDAF